MIQQGTVLVPPRLIRGWEFKKVPDLSKIIFRPGLNLEDYFQLRQDFIWENGPRLRNIFELYKFAACFNAEATLLSEAGLAFRQSKKLPSGAKLFPQAEVQ